MELSYSLGLLFLWLSIVGFVSLQKVIIRYVIMKTAVSGRSLFFNKGQKEFPWDTCLKKEFSFSDPNKRPITSNWGNKTIKKISAELQHVNSWSHQCCFVSFPSKNYKKHFWLWHDKALKQIPLAQQWLVHNNAGHYNWPARYPHISHFNHFSCFRKHFGLLSWHQPIRTVGHHGNERKEIKTLKKHFTGQ